MENARPTTITHLSQFSLMYRMLGGAAIGLVLISLFLLTVNEPDPEWGAFWKLRPLLMVTLAGAAGGLCNYFMVTLGSKAGLHKIWAILLSVIVFIIGLWMGAVLGLHGILWD